MQRSVFSVWAQASVCRTKLIVQYLCSCSLFSASYAVKPWGGTSYKIVLNEGQPWSASTALVSVFGKIRLEADKETACLEKIKIVINMKPIPKVT